MAVQEQDLEVVVYPESDGQPMADNTKQFRWIVTIEGGLDALFRDVPDIFVAGDLLWYPVEGKPFIRMAPDVLVAFGRPKGDRGSYLQWREANVPLQVVFEILSPGNTLKEMARKFEFYDLYGVEEYYLYDPDSGEANGWLRSDDRLRLIEEIDGWVSPRLGVRFALSGGELTLFRPDGQRFATYVELEQQREQEQQAREQAQAQAEQERQRAEQERQRADQEREARELAQGQAEEERLRADQERLRAERLIAQLRSLGVEPGE